MTKYQSSQQSQWANFQIEHEALAAGSGQTAVTTKLVGGVYRAALPTYDDGDAALLHFTSDGKLMVDTELTLDGNIIVNNLGGAAANDAAIAGNPLQMGAYAATFDGAALPGAVNAEGDVIYVKASLSGVQYVMPVNQDGSLTTIYGEDSVHSSGHGGTFVLAVRNDAGVSLAGTDGDYAPLSVDSTGALSVSLDASYADDSAFTIATDEVVAVGFLADEAAIDSVDEGDVGLARMTLNRQVIVTQRLTDGTELAYGAGGSGVTVPRLTLASDDPAVTALQIMDDWDNVAFAETESESSNSAFTTSAIYGFDSEAGAGSQLRAAQVAVDNAGLSATPNVLVGGGIYKTSFDTYGDNDAVPLHFDVSGRLHATINSENKPAVTNATGAIAIATSTTIANHFRLVAVTVHFSAAPVTSENLTVTLNANDGVAYDTVLFSVDPSATAATDIVYIPDKELLFESGDELDVAYTNTDTRTYGLRIVTQLV